MGEMRKAYGQALVEIGGENENVVVVDADLSASTKTSMFKDVYPTRHFNAGIAEQNMMGMAAGLAVSGKIVFASTFAVFGTARPYEIIRNLICHNNLNVKIVCTHAGITVGEDGATHQSIEDIAIMRALPNMKVLVAADASQAYAMIKDEANKPGPTYIRLTRSKSADVYTDEYSYKPGCAEVLKQGKDISIFACGLMVDKALQAACSLKNENIEAEVIDLSQIKPLDSKTIIQSVRKTNLALCVEEHSVYGGLGSAAAEALSKEYPVKMDFIGINDTFGTSGKADSLLKFYNLTEENIIKKVKELLKQR
jgi:transketolase